MKKLTTRQQISARVRGTCKFLICPTNNKIRFVYAATTRSDHSVDELRWQPERQQRRPPVRGPCIYTVKD